MNKIKKLIIQLLNFIRAKVIPCFAINPTLSRLYYLLFDRAFGYEQQAILKAKLSYKANQGIQNNSSSLLRRNIHRLEKGLIMRPRRALFALSYIEETVAVYEKAAQRQLVDKGELEWAHSVLNKFFAVSDTNHPTINACFERFKAINSTDETTRAIPYPSHKRVPHQVTPEQLRSLCQHRRSVRWFKDEEVAKESILEALTIATEAPSACNRQAFEFMWITDPALKEKASKLPGGTAGFASQIPCLLAVVGDLSAYPSERDRHVIYIDASLASMQFMLACETLGLSTCPINWPELHKLDKQVTNLLSLPQYKRVVMFIAVGYALDEGEIPFSYKKKADDLLTIIK